MSVKMDLKSDDILSIEIDSDLLLSYGLGQLSIDDNIPNDIFEFPEETPKNCNNVDVGNDLPSENEVEKPDLGDKCKVKLSTENKTCNDINGNEESLSSENLNQLFDKLELSDSNNDKLKGLNSGNCKVELSDTHENKVEPSESYSGKVELSKSYNEKVELADSCNKNVEVLCKNKSKLSVSDNGKTELSNYDNIKVEQFDSDNGKTELSNYDNIKVEQFDSDNGKTELINYIKVELFDSDNDVKGELSDSDNEASEDCLRERGGAIKNKSRKHRDQSNNFSRNRKSIDKSQINPQTLNNWAGSRLIKSNEPNYVDQYAFQLDLTSIYTGYENVPTSSRQDYFYEDARAKAVSSPESGYESSSALSGSSSPPLFTSTALSGSSSPPLLPSVTVDDILEFLVEVDREGALTDHKLATCDSDGKEAKINKIIDYLQDIPSDLRESCNEPSNYLRDIPSDSCDSYNEPTSNYLKDIPSDLCASFNELTSNYLNDISSDLRESCNEITSNNIQGCVPLVNSTPELSIQPVPLLCNIASKNVETPKSLAFKLKDKAKRALQEFFSANEERQNMLYAAKKRIYSRIWEIKKEDIKVIYVEDEDDKASENRTNLHHAVLESRIEDIYCLVEIQKQYQKPLADINIRDKYGRTALDYAIQRKMTLVVEYLKENTACKSVNI